MPDRSSPRVALLGFSIECNKFAPPATKAHFLARTYLEGDAIVEEARSPTPTMLPETPGFVAAMDASGPWTPVGIALAMTEPNGPVEHAFFVELLDTISRRLRAALPVDAVYICSHGAGLTTEEDDPDGVLFEMVREIVGPDVPIAATLDLHANVSERMVQSIDVFIGYRTNPHLDMRERGAEAAGGDPRDAGRRQAAARLHPPADRAADGDDADRRRSLRRDDRSRPAPDDPRDHERLGDGRVCLCRHRQERPDRRGDRAPRQARSRDAGARDRRTRLGQSGAVLSAADLARRGRRERRSRSGAIRRCRPSPLPMSPTTRAAAGAATRPSCCARFTRPGVDGRAARRLLRPRSRRRGASARCRRALRGAVQPVGDHQVLRALHRAGDGGRADRRQLRRPARHLCRAAARARAVRRARRSAGSPSS